MFQDQQLSFFLYDPLPHLGLLLEHCVYLPPEWCLCSIYLHVAMYVFGTAVPVIIWLIVLPGYTISKTHAVQSLTIGVQCYPGKSYACQILQA